jgi:hypothetical protein
MVMSATSLSRDERVFGEPRVLADVDRHEVKGNLVSARPRYLRERWGESALEDVASRLSEQSRKLVLSPTLPFAWYPLRDMAEIDRAIVNGPMQGDVSQMKHFGATIARYDLSTIYKMLFKLGTPAFVIRRINVAYRTYIRGGSMRGETPSSSSAVVTFVDGAFPIYLCRYGVAGWLTAAIELSGGHEVRVEETACRHSGSEHCRWEASWS